MILVAALVLCVLFVVGMMMFPATETLPSDGGVVDTQEVPNQEAPAAAGSDAAVPQAPASATGQSGTPPAGAPAR